MRVVLAAAPQVRAQCPPSLIAGTAIDVSTWIKPHVPVDITITIELGTLHLTIESTGETAHGAILWEIMSLEITRDDDV